jgi:hypothetical protein
MPQLLFCSVHLSPHRLLCTLLDPEAQVNWEEAARPLAVLILFFLFLTTEASIFERSLYGTAVAV